MITDHPNVGKEIALGDNASDLDFVLIIIYFLRQLVTVTTNHNGDIVP